MAPESVVVVGAGIAGLTAAHRLSKLGIDVTVLEASERVGGRMSTERRGGYVIDRGAQFLSDGYAVIGALIGELGLAKSICRASEWTGFMRDLSVRRINARRPWTLASSGLLRWRDLFRVSRAGLALAWRTRKRPLSDYSAWHSLDDTDAAEWIAASFGRESLDYVFEPMLEGFYFQAPEQMSRAWPAVVWSFGARGRGAIALAEGLGSLPEALAQGLKIHLATPVESIEPSRSGVAVKSSAGTIQANYVVLATTVTAARKLYSPDNEVERHLLNAGYSSSINISFAIPDGVSTAKVPPDVYGLLIPRKERRVIAAIALESRKCPSHVPAGELLNVMLSGTAGSRLIDAPDDEVLAEVLPGLERYFPGMARKIAFVQFNRWKEAEPRSPVGRSRDLRRYRETWDTHTKVILAGDYMSIPCAEGAAESGEWAANRLISSP